MVWKLCVDTGGTFTDCVGESPGGERCRAKVLSSSALRGEVQEITGSRSVVVASDLPDVDGFADGTSLEWLSPKLTGTHIVQRHDGGSNQIHLHTDLPMEICPGSRFELRFHDEAPVLAARLVTRTPAGSDLPPIEMRLATTRGTNALLQRRGARTVFFVTRGFADLMLIDDQRRDDLFSFAIRRPAPLYEEVVEVRERRAADGTLLDALDLSSLSDVIDDLLERGFEAAAVAFLNSYRNPSHEIELEAELRRRGFRWVSSSAAIAPQIKLLPRAQTTVVDAYLSPVVAGYLDRIGLQIPADSIRLMSSAGGLVPRRDYRPKDSLLSGPAGGVVGAVAAGRECGFDHLISFDMGGTSTDVARYDGRFRHRFEHRVGDARVAAPALAIETIAAGGGSICSFDGNLLEVGPLSAGARPGPACYGADGPLTITDCNLLLGRLDESRFRIPLDRGAAEVSALKLAAQLRRQSHDLTVEQMLHGFLRIANQRMAAALRRISVSEGCDATEYLLVAFGGAGGQHACAVASLLGMRRILIPIEAGLLSARGLETASIERFAQRQVLHTLEGSGKSLERIILELEQEALGLVSVPDLGTGPAQICSRYLYLRLAGQDSTLEIEWQQGSSEGQLRRQFVERFAKVFGYKPPGRAIEIESARVCAAIPSESPHPRTESGGGSGVPRLHRFWHEGDWLEIELWERRDLQTDSTILGPAVITDPYGCTVVELGWRASVTTSGALMLEADPRASSSKTRPDAGQKARCENS